MSGAKAKWIQVTQAVTSKTTFDKRAKEKDYFKSSGSICEESFGGSTFTPKYVDDKMKDSAMHLFWSISNCNKGSTKKKDFLINRELDTLKEENGTDFLKDLLIHICELDHTELIKQGVPIVELCGKFTRFLATKKASLSSGSSSSSGSSKGSNTSPGGHDKSMNDIPSFKINPSKRNLKPQVVLTLKDSPQFKRKKLNPDDMKPVPTVKKVKPGAFNLAKAVTNSVRKSTTGLRRFVSGSVITKSAILNTNKDQISFDITSYVLDAVRSHQGHYLIQSQPINNFQAQINLSIMLCWICGKNSYIKKPDFYIQTELDVASQEPGRTIEFFQELLTTMSKISASALSKEGINLDLAMGHLAIYVVQQLRTMELQVRGSPKCRRLSDHGIKRDRGLTEVEVGLVCDNSKNNDQVIRLPKSRRVVKPIRKSLTGTQKKDPVAITLFKD